VPNSSLHRKQAQHNKKLLNEDFFNIKKTKYLDWTITICYYYTLHIIDEKLAEYGVENVGKHDNRRDMVRNILEPDFSGLRTLYNNLESKSVIARYHCVTIDNEMVAKALMCMKDIESLLQ
jgi:hypothetical protein